MSLFVNNNYCVIRQQEPLSRCAVSVHGLDHVDVDRPIGHDVDADTDRVFSCVFGVLPLVRFRRVIAESGSHVVRPVVVDNRFDVFLSLAGDRD